MPDPKDPAPPPPDDDKPEPTVTEQELQDRIAAAVEAARKEERDKAKKKAKRKPEPEPEAEDDDEAEDTAEIIRKAEMKAAEAQQRADDAEKKALLSEVSVRLRDFLATNHPQYVKSAPDIMLHVEKALSPGAKDAEIVRVYESHAKAFMERNPIARKPASGATVGGNPRITDNPAERRSDLPRVPVDRRPRSFSSLDYHG